jgi:integrase
MPGQARILSQAEIRDLFQILGNTRDRTIFDVGLYTGLRISETIAIKQSQVSPKMAVRFHQNSQRSVPSI